MSDFIISFKNSFLCTIKDGGFIFWCILYPIILISIMFFAFSGIAAEEISEIDIGYDEKSPAIAIIDEIEYINGKKMNLKEAEIELKDKKIISYLKEDGNLLVTERGMYQSIVKSIADISKKWMTLYKEGKDLNKTDFETSFIKEVNQDNRPFDIIYFSTIAMFSLYGYFGGISIIENMLPNRSIIGQRFSISPLKKSKSLIAAMLTIVFLNIISNILLLIYVVNILKLGLINDIPKTIFLIISGNIFGTGLGIFIGSSLNLSEGLKIGIGVAFTLLLAFVSGMMNPKIKYMLDSELPIINKINPISLITDNLYRVNMLGMNGEYLKDGISIIIAGFAFIILSAFFLRRQRYDSL
ncbi:MAG: ABC transporter permease [Tissierellia bacterium]|nr:ABC transporter permease [Tissierellia bacterium]